LEDSLRLEGMSKPPVPRRFHDGSPSRKITLRE
jgi:hypothetical protein